MLALLGALALAAPWIATPQPWVVVRADGWQWFPEAPAEEGARWILRAPIPYAPGEVDLDAVLRAPSAHHVLGTDGLGRDLAARLVHGGRVSLGVGLLTALLALAVGLPLGAAAGYFGGWVDAGVSRAVEALLCFPGLVLALALLTISPPPLQELPDALRLASILAVAGWIPVARYARGEFLRLRSSEMAMAARAAGAGHLRVLVRHVLPSALAPVLVSASFTVAHAILLESALSFLGLGVQPPTPTWGRLLKEAWTHIETAWWLALFPGLALFLSVFACNLIAEGCRDWLDPKAGAP